MLPPSTAVLTLAFGGEDALSGMTMPLPRPGRQAYHRAFCQLATEARRLPAFFVHSILLERGGRACISAIDHHDLDAPPGYRSLTLAERSQVALWSSRLTLVDDGTYFDVPPSLLEDLLLGDATATAMLASLPSTRKQTFVAPSHQIYMTVEVRQREAKLTTPPHALASTAFL